MKRRNGFRVGLHFAWLGDEDMQRAELNLNAFIAGIVINGFRNRE